MKKLNLLLKLIGISLLLSSCSTDDSNGQDQANNELIIGKWNVTAINDIPDGDCELESYLEIFDDGTFLDQTFGGFSGQCSADTPITGTWTLSNNIYVQTFDEPNTLIVDLVRHEVLELTETTMTLRFTINYPSIGELTETWSYEREINISKSY